MVVIASSLWDRLGQFGSWTIPEKILRTAVVYFAIVILLRIFGKAGARAAELVRPRRAPAAEQRRPERDHRAGQLALGWPARRGDVAVPEHGRGAGRQALALARPALRRPEERDRHRREVRREGAHAARAPARRRRDRDPPAGRELDRRGRARVDLSRRRDRGAAQRADENATRGDIERLEGKLDRLIGHA